MHILKILMISVVTVLIFSYPPQTVWSGTTERVSVSSDGEQGNIYSRGGSLSADGRFVAFESYADKLVPGDTNADSDVFVNDRQTGQTTRVNVSSDGEQGNDYSTFCSLSADGRFVAFDSYADKLVPGDTNAESDVFVHDRQTGQTTRVNVSSDGIQANGDSVLWGFSADGRFVAFFSDADNLVPGDTNEQTDVFVHDRYGDELSTNVFSPSFDDTSTWAVYKDTNNKDTKVVTFADGGDLGEKYKVVVRTTTGDRINYMFTSKGSGYAGCDKSAHGGEWPGYRKIDLRPNSGVARLVKMKMTRRSGTGAKQAYVGFLGSGDQGWDQTSGPADACGWLATGDSDDAFLLDVTDDMLTLQTGHTVDGQTMVGQIEEPDLHVSNDVFSPRFNDTATWAVYKDKNYKDTRVITFADAGAPGEKYKVVIKTTTGDTINYIFTSKKSGYTGCDRSAYDGEWPGYRKIVLGSNAGYAKLLKMKMIKSSGAGSRSAYVGFFGRGDKGWIQTSGPADGCGW